MDFDFSRAEQMLPQNTRKLAFQLGVDAHWLDSSGSRFWYRRELRRDGEENGKQFVLVDSASGDAAPAFDHARLAARLTSKLALDKPLDPNNLPFDDIQFHSKSSVIWFTIESRRWQCALDSYECKLVRGWKPVRDHEVVSPDGKWVAFLRGNNLAVRSLETGQSKLLTRDGKKNYNYASRPDFYGAKTLDLIENRKQKPMVLWSPDSSRLLTHRLDQRRVRQLPVMQYVTAGEHTPAKARFVRYPLAGDEAWPTVEHMIFGMDGSRVNFQTDPLEIRNTDALLSPFWQNLWWSEDGKQVFYIHPMRGYRAMQFFAADSVTGAVRLLLEEHSETFLDQDMRVKKSPVPDARVLSKHDAFIWASYRDGWYHLYLHDLATGRPLHPLTSGNWTVRELVDVDEERGWVYFLGAGREPHRDPYLQHLYRVRIDGTGLELLTPEDAEHDIQMAPDLHTFVDTYSKVNLAPVTVLRSTQGRIIHTLESADIELLLQAGYQLPEPFCVKAADGETDLYGILIPPANFDATKEYPLIEYEYGGVHTFITPKAFPLTPDGFDRAHYGQSLTQLGFAVVIMDGRGTPGRSKAFHDFSAERLGEAAGLVDHAAAIPQIAAQFPFIDEHRVGMYGFSGGGYGSARAILTYPDVYKVAVGSCGDHDNRLYDATWWERYMGIGDFTRLQPQDNQSLAANLQGKLLLIHGDVDDNVHPANTMRLVDALIKADKEFDMLLMPNRGHALGRDAYVRRRIWAYFLRNL
jgi:dipeptidyl-peptidase 4